MVDVSTPATRAELSARWRRVFALMALVGFAVFVASYLGVLIYWSWGDDSWMLPILRDHFAATVGAPTAALAALVVVLILRITAGPIEFKLLGIEFKGAAGPIVLWDFCFLSIVAAVKLLW